MEVLIDLKTYLEKKRGEIILKIGDKIASPAAGIIQTQNLNGGSASYSTSEYMSITTIENEKRLNLYHRIISASKKREIDWFKHKFIIIEIENI